MFGIGTTELIIVLVIILLLFGPKRLPELARGLGRMIHELRHGANKFQDGLRGSGEEPKSRQETATAKVEPAPPADPSKQAP